MVFPLASVSKLMTALVAVENIDPKRMATVSKNSYNTYGAEGNLVLGEKLKISDLMHPLLMESSNDGAEVIADDFGRVEFMSLMNKKAAELGMNSTYYNDPSGLDPKNNSTAKDQFKLAKYIFEKYPSILDTTLVKIYKVGVHTWTNRNGYLNFSTFIGGKNGFIDEAKQTTVSVFDVPMYKGGNRTVVLVILQSVDRYADGMKLIEFLKNSVTYKPRGLSVGDSVIQ
jgi:D-alanyl-D-alanine carboxypeptidase (penicillin-binding protein 5/6)